jgi:hypothetical protein
MKNSSISSDALLGSCPMAAHPMICTSNQPVAVSSSLLKRMVAWVIVFLNKLNGSLEKRPDYEPAKNTGEHFQGFHSWNL